MSDTANGAPKILPKKAVERVTISPSPEVADALRRQQKEREAHKHASSKPGPLPAQQEN